MDNLCHRCNAEVAPGTPFCPQCGAPQIRVAPSVQQSPVSQIERDEDLQSALGNPPSAIRWSSALPKAAVSGFATVALLILVVSLTRMAALSLLVLPLGGAFSVLLYVRGNTKQRLTPGAGARLGAVTGLFSFAVYCLIAAPELSSRRAEILNTVRKSLEEAAAQSSDPQAHTFVQVMMTPAGITTLFVLAAIIILIVFLVLSTLGGSVGAAIFQNSQREED